MKNLLDTLFDTALWLLLWGMAAYAILSFAAYTAAADEVLTPNERIVALTLLGEARGEGKAGLYAVACVIQLRSEQRKLTPAQVCKQRKQFSIWNGKTEKDLQHLWKSKEAPYARELAGYLCKGFKFAQSYTGWASHYHAKSVEPYWMPKGRRVPSARIGNHIFWNLHKRNVYGR